MTTCYVVADPLSMLLSCQIVERLSERACLIDFVAASTRTFPPLLLSGISCLISFWSSNSLSMHPHAQATTVPQSPAAETLCPALAHQSPEVDHPYQAGDLPSHQILAVDHQAILPAAETLQTHHPVAAAHPHQQLVLPAQYPSAVPVPQAY